MTLKEVSKEELKKLYDKDYPLWAEINLHLLKEKAYELVDWENLLEEIEDMGTRHLDACISYLAIILEHMYKWDRLRNLAGGETAGNSWKRSIRNARREIEAMFELYPSLRNKLPDNIHRSWVIAKKSLKNWLDDNSIDPDTVEVPKICPYSYREAMEREF